MKCNVSKEELIGYLYREMEEGEQQALEEHLTQCPACQKELEELSQASRLLRAWQPEEPNLKLVFVNENPRRGKLRPGEWAKAFARRRWVLGVAGAAALALIIFSIFRWGAFPGRNEISVVEKDGGKPPANWESTSGERDSLGSFRQFINGNELPEHFVFTQKPRERIRRDIDVMANIMDAALEKKYQTFFQSRGKTHGIYMDGLGAVFFLQDSGSDSTGKEALQVIEELRTHKNFTFSTRYPDAWRDEKSKESWENFETALLEVVGDYSHTLRPLQPTESVVVAIDLDKKRGFYSNKPQRFLLKVKKKDLDAYNRGQIRLAEFRKKVEVQQY